jgi:hypothetical protein
VADAYDMRSNIKGKPGSQGTLFQVKDKGLLNPQQRWPQGYTPERLNEVREGLSHVPVSPPEHFYHQPQDETLRQHGVNEFGLRERVTRELARTTVPPEHLRNLTDIHGEPAENTHGTYWKGAGRREIGIDMTGETHRAEDIPEGSTLRDEQRKTLVHEIGHHVNMTLAPRPHEQQLVAQIHAHNDAKKAYENGDREHWEPTATDVAMKYSHVAAGVGEAQADNYMVEHFRTGGRKSTSTVRGAYEETFSPRDRDRQYPGYNDVRSPQAALNHNQFNEQVQPAMISRVSVERDQERAGHQTPLQRRLAAQRDAVQNAVGAHLQ